MHVTEVDATALHFHWANYDRAGSNDIDIHVSVCATLKLLGRDRVLVGSSDQKRAKVAGIVRVRHADRRGGSQLAHEWPQPSRQPHQVVGRKRQNRVLDRILRQRRKRLRVARNSFSGFAMERQTNAAISVESHRVTVGDPEWCGIRSAMDAADGRLSDAFHARFRIKYPAARTTPRNIWVP